MQLTGLDTTVCRELLQEKGLEKIDDWETLISDYQGNPLWIKIAATFIQDLGESANQFLLTDYPHGKASSYQMFLPKELQDILKRHLERLSETEKQVVSVLARESDGMNLARLLENSTISLSDLLDTLRSLSRRQMIKNKGVFIIYLLFGDSISIKILP